MADVTAEQRRAFAKSGIAMPDGSYYIRNGPDGPDDLKSAIRLVGMGNNSDLAIRKHIIKRAEAIGRLDMLPDSWNHDGTLKHVEDPLENFLQHYGVKGMHWGVRKNRGGGGVRAKVPANSSEDHQQASLIRAKAKQSGGIHALSNAELRSLTERMNLEQQYSRLTSSDVDRGRSFVKNRISDVKLGLDAVETGRRVYTQINDLQKVAKK